MIITNRHCIALEFKPTFRSAFSYLIPRLAESFSIQLFSILVSLNVYLCIETSQYLIKIKYLDEKFSVFVVNQAATKPVSDTQTTTDFISTLLIEQKCTYNTSR